MKQILEQKLKEALRALQQAGGLPEFALPAIRVERPKDEQFGEYTTNIALAVAKQAKKNPLEIAELLKEKLNTQEFEKIEVVKPGYINFYLAQQELVSVLQKVLKEGKGYGGSTFGQGVKVNNEFISANPTGPLTVGNGRGGFYGDVLAKVLRKASFEVVNEYYVNDGGQQVIKLGHSVLKDEEAVYGGEYIDELHQQRVDKKLHEDVKVLGEWAAEEILERYIKPTVEKNMHIHFDSWLSERTELKEKGYVERAVEMLIQNNHTYEKDGALWFRTTDFGDDKDRVLKKSDGTYAYIAPDCGYFLNRMERGFKKIFITLGADHHGFVSRLHAAAKALGFQGELVTPITQLVKVVKDGVEVRMSKRAGNVITIDELIEKVGHDVARFFFLMYAPETHMNFDLGLAEERSQKNPVFYVEYAHARLCSILRKAEEEGISFAEADLMLLVHEKERELIRELMFFPELIETVATDFSVHKLPQYALKLSEKFHSFYDACRVIDPENKELTQARLQLVQATKIVLAETLGLMGISAPEKM